MFIFTLWTNMCYMFSFWKFCWLTLIVNWEKGSKPCCHCKTTMPLNTNKGHILYFCTYTFGIFIKFYTCESYVLKVLCFFKDKRLLNLQRFASFVSFNHLMQWRWFNSLVNDLSVFNYWVFGVTRDSKNCWYYIVWSEVYNICIM